VLEIHVHDRLMSLENDYRMRIRIQTADIKQQHEQKVKEKEKIEHVYAKDALEAFQIYKHYSTQFVSNEKHYKRMQMPPDRALGSKQLKETVWSMQLKNSGEASLDDKSRELIEMIWKEAVGDLEELFGAEINDEQFGFSVEQVSII
jgi:hypothetical protein